MILCWSAKGGSGTTVVAAALSLVLSTTRSTTIADLGGDIPAALGLPEPSGPGLTDWLASPDAEVDALGRLAVDINSTLRLLPRGAAPMPATPRWADLTTALDHVDEEVVIDAGTGEPPDELARCVDQSLLVIRPCYLAMRRLIAMRARPTGVIVVDEPGRNLRCTDLAQSIGVPVVAQVPFDPAVFNSVNAGLLAGRLPRSLSHALRDIA
jgi:MinD superfamily P-loop ATPase